MERGRVIVNGEKIYVKGGFLDLYSRGITDISEIEGLDTLTNLELLNLSGNQIATIHGLDALTNLKWLNLSNNQIATIQGLDTLTNLKWLNLSNNQIATIHGLDTLTNLKSLIFRANWITIIHGLDSLTNLQRLILSGNQITTIQGLDTLFNLQFLSLGSNEITSIQGLDTLFNLQFLDLCLNKITTIQGLDKLTNLQELNLEYNNIKKAKEFIKLLDFSNIKTIQFDYQNFEDPHNEDIVSIRKFLLNSYDWMDRNRDNSFISGRKKNLDNMIKIASILINLYLENGTKKNNYRVKFEKLMEERINLEREDTPKYYEILALKNVFYAGMGRDRSEQIEYLDIAIEFFEKANKPKCVFFYTIYSLLSKSVLASTKNELKESKECIKKILDLHGGQKDMKLHPSLQKIIDVLPEFQEKFIDYTKFPERWEKMITECSKKCFAALREECPELQYSKPFIYRIVDHIVDDMKYSVDKALIFDDFKPPSKEVIKGIKEAIKISKKCKSEENRISPKVGAVVIKDNKKILSAYRGETSSGDHAEYIVLEKKGIGMDLKDSILITTLEPCTFRHSPKIPCARRIINAGIKQIWIGLLDPNPGVVGRGETYLTDQGISIQHFPPKFVKQVKEINKEFWDIQTKKYHVKENGSQIDIMAVKKTHFIKNLKKNFGSKMMKYQKK